MNSVEFLTSNPPWSRNQLRKLGKAIGKSQEFDAELLDQFLEWNAQLTVDGELLLNRMVGRFVQCHPITVLSDYRFQQQPIMEISGRTKHRDTLFEKLRRSPHADISRIRDIAGLRIDCEFVRSDQYALCAFVGQQFSEISDSIECKIVDRIADPRSGYRALHLEVLCPAGFIEIQIRTSLQYQWANSYEYLADLFGREIRYRKSDDPVMRELQERMHQISDQFSRFENEVDQFVDSARKVEKMHFDLWLSNVGDPEFIESREYLGMNEPLLKIRAHLDSLMVSRATLVQSMESMRQDQNERKGI